MPEPQEVLSHYDVTYRWERGKETGWATIGRAFPNDDGSINVKFDSMPVPGIAANPGDFRLFPKTKAKAKADKEAKLATNLVVDAVKKQSDA